MMRSTFLREIRWLHVGWGLVVLGIWAAMLDFPNTIAGDDLEPSWGQALGHFVSHRSQAGTDYIFTYGPLGYFSTEIYDASLFNCAFWWNIIIALIFALSVVRVARFSSRLFGALFFVFVVTAVDFPVPGNKEDFFRTLMLVILLPLLRPARVSPRLLLFSVMVMAVIAQVKFTYAVLAIVGMGCAEVRYRLESARAIASPLILFIPAFCLTWMLAGQSLWNLPRYAHASFEVSTGYLAAMGSPNLDAFHTTFIAVTLLCLLLILTILHCQSDRISLRRLAIASILLVNAWLAWKHAITRSDSRHLLLLPGLLAILFLLLPIMLPQKPGSRLSLYRFALLAIAVLLSGYSFCRLTVADVIPWSLTSVRANLNVIASPSRYKIKMGNKRADLARLLALPHIQSIVGANSADIMSVEQGVLLLNDLNYHPRPVFQSYGTNTHFLIHANGEFFESDLAPDYVLFKPHPVDYRLPALEDSQALLELANRYSPVAVEKGFCLLQRLKHPRQSTLIQPADHRVVIWNSPIDLPDPGNGYQTVSLKIKPSLRGRVESFLYKEPEVDAVLRLSTGQICTFRIVPVMAEDEFFLSPLLFENLLPLYVPSAGQKIASLFFTTSEPSSFTNEIEFELRTYRGEIGPAEAARLKALFTSPTPAPTTAPAAPDSK